MKRDTRREERFMQQLDAERATVDHVRERLIIGQELYGDSWAEIGIGRLFDELLEEAADLIAWSLLADQALDLDPRFSARQAKEIRDCLRFVAQVGAGAHRALRRIRNRRDGQ